MAVTPGKPVERPHQCLRTQTGDVPERVLEHALLRSDLRALLDMLHGAPAAGAEERAPRRGTCGAFFFDPHDLRGFPRGLLAVSGVFDAFARDGIIDEHGFSPDVGHAATLPVERLDKGDRHRGLQAQLHRLTNSRQWASLEWPSVSRTSSSSLR